MSDKKMYYIESHVVENTANIYLFDWCWTVYKPTQEYFPYTTPATIMVYGRKPTAICS